MNNSNNKKKSYVIPGFRLSFGIVTGFLGLFVVIPLCVLALYSLELSFDDFIANVTSPRVFASYRTSISTAFTASLVNAVMGLMIAWVLVRYRFPGKRLMDGMIELPFALPTAVAGIALTHLTVTEGWIGRIFAKFGVSVAYTRIGITIALIFIGIPFVVRSVQPVLEKLEPEFEEAAATLGASPAYTFFHVILPEIFPSLFAGFSMAFARCIGEYGSVVFIAGNTPYETEITPLIIMAKLQEFDYASATSIALVMLLLSFFILFVNAIVQIRAAKLT